MDSVHSADITDAVGNALDVLISGDDRQEGLRLACAVLADAVGSARICIADYGSPGAGEHSQARCRLDWRSAQADVLINDSDAASLPVDGHRSIWARPGLSAAPVVTQANDAGPIERVWLEGQGVATIASIPVHIPDRFIGSLNLFHTGEEYRWPAEDLIALSTCARPLVSAYLRYEAGASLDATRDLSREAFEKSVVGMTILGADGTMLEVNDAYCRLFGYERHELLGRNTLMLAHPDDIALVHEMRPAGLMNPELTDAERRFVRSDGTVIWTQCTVSRLDPGNREPGPSVPTFAGQVRDITSVRQDSVILELQRSNRELEQFAYIASHDLQEPLRMITSYLELLQRRYAGQLDNDADEFIAFAVDGAQRLRALVNSLLIYSRLDSQPATFQPVRLTESLEHALQALRLLIEENEAEVVYDDLPLVNGDSAQLSQLFQNLIENAVKFRREDAPQIRIVADRSHQLWTIEVHDNGIGFDPEQAERIFGVFRRLHGYGQYPGTGIGLAICKRIVERHGGRIEASATIGAGSTFRFTLPALRS